MSAFVRAIRILVAAAIVIAIIGTTIETAARVPINPFNFFGYFTIQSNIIIAVVYLLTAARASHDPRGWLVLARASATSYLIVVGIVYALLLAPLGAAGGVPLPWANFILHILVPLYAAADWLLIGDRTRLPFRHLWVAAVYPLLWCGVVLVRGATDGWVPYPFLDPATGYPSVLFFVLVSRPWALYGLRRGTGRPGDRSIATRSSPSRNTARRQAIMGSPRDGGR